MIFLGHLTLYVGLVAAAWATFGGLFAGLKQWKTGTQSAERALHLAAFASLGSCMVLSKFLLDRDYRLAYVWEYTSNTLGDIYALSALWAGQEGSLLFWLTTLGVMSSIAVARNRSRHPELAPHAIWILGSVQLFFFVLLCVVASPFKLLVEKFPEAAGQIIPDGNGLNPMLQNFGMIIHPPLLYVGYIGFTIPFAFGIAALVSGHLTPDWIRTSRAWTIISWAALSFGILTGAKWAYVELGWGGYWAWDPVENASLMPWLTGTAFLHSVMIEERRGMLRRWNIFLVLLTFLLSIFGTFLTRSGLLQSVHAFAQSGVGNTFIYFMVGWAFIGGGLLAWRWKDLESRHDIESLMSREAFFLFQNLVLLGICGAVMWGTMYPIISEAFTGDKVTVAAPYFNRVIVPLGLALFLLTGAGPMIAWRQASGTSLRRNLGIPAFAGAVAGGISLLLGSRDAYSVGAFALAIFVIASILMDIFICARARQKQTGEGLGRSAFLLMDRNRRRYGGFLVHVGMAALLIGLAGNAFTQEIEKHVAPGETFSIGEYELRYIGNFEEKEAHRTVLKAKIELARAGRVLGEKLPEISIYFAGQEREQRNTEVAIRSEIFHDLYLIFVEPDGERAVLRAMIHPLVSFVWNGGLLAIIGALLALIPWKLPFAWAKATVRNAAAPTALALIVFAGGPAAAEYSNAIGNRDPVSGNLVCLCGCRMNLQTCDHKDCGGCSKQLGDLAIFRAQGLDEEAMLSAMTKKYGLVVLGAPPASGVHLAAWIVPFGVLAASAAGLWGWLRKRRARISVNPVEPPDDETRRLVEAALLKSKP